MLSASSSPRSRAREIPRAGTRSTLPGLAPGASTPRGRGQRGRKAPPAFPGLGAPSGNALHVSGRITGRHSHKWGTGPLFRGIFAPPAGTTVGNMRRVLARAVDRRGGVRCGGRTGCVRGREDAALAARQRRRRGLWPIGLGERRRPQQARPLGAGDHDIHPVPRALPPARRPRARDAPRCRGAAVVVPRRDPRPAERPQRLDSRGLGRAQAGRPVAGRLPRLTEVRALRRRETPPDGARRDRSAGNGDADRAVLRPDRVRARRSIRSSARTRSRRAGTRSSPTGRAAAWSASMVRTRHGSSGRRSRTAACASGTATSSRFAATCGSARRSRSSAHSAGRGARSVRLRVGHRRPEASGREGVERVRLERTGRQRAVAARGRAQLPHHVSAVAERVPGDERLPRAA